MQANYNLADIERLLSKVDFSGDCWRWTGSKNEQGYGAIAFRGKIWKAHRVSWTVFNGEIPDEELVLHRCDNPPCCKPSHLFLGSKLENYVDMVNKGRGVVLQGESHGMAKLTNSQVAEIRLCYVKGRGRYFRGNSPELAKRFNVSISTICRIATHKMWA